VQHLPRLRLSIETHCESKAGRRATLSYGVQIDRYDLAVNCLMHLLTEFVDLKCLPLPAWTFRASC
jgi:hypothetical protein